VALAIETGIPAREWLEDPRAMVTAVELLEERAERMKRRR
jgi:hypothetical protein